MNFWKVYDVGMPKYISNFEFEDKRRSTDFVGGGAIFIAKSVTHSMMILLLLKSYWNHGMIL
ncbi:TPA: hypothetical protein DEP94_02595 [Candidatus Nomurabacteria bacterium]|nr:hypothetical protein [Candidatus Nomurabacteria bacterium]